ncbi:MAG: RluA family pseudouridine synthase [Chloroflexi bacterium HGW-Chloroflexi-9]|nr:MAG: RluA family pseudouridine synthase [Chloroflexi bacterium HGW-Chloroflexi-9]
MTPVTRFVVPEEARLDLAVTAHMPALSRSQVRRLIEAGKVEVDGAAILKPGVTVGRGVAVAVEEPTLRDMDVAAADVPLSILYEDEETLVLDKQPGLVVHPREGVQEVTLINAVRARYPEVAEIDDSDRGGIVHRLDRDTSGVIALAKSEESQAALKEQWRNRETSKTYLALVEGRVEPSRGIVDAPLGADPEDPRRRAVVEKGQSARSEYRVLEQYGDEAALLLVDIFTGRTHQIRVHLAAIGYPVVGDTLYGQESPLIGRQALHAWRLGFTLASNGAWRLFEAPVPRDMKRAIRQLRAKHPVTPCPEIGALS